MIIKNYGLFWRRDEIEWNPGGGNQFRMIGRLGERNPRLRLANLRPQVGIYILYGNYGPYYVGLARASLGNRLRDHVNDHHSERWDRFSWFGFREISDNLDERGFCVISEDEESRTIDTNAVIGDIEALLIKAMGTENNIQQMNFAAGNEWKQVVLDEIERYERRVR